MSSTSDPPFGTGDSTTLRDAPDFGQAESDADTIPLGTQVAGRYWVLGVAGSGGMGHVYRAYDPRLGREVALKQLHVFGRTAERRLALEARAMAQLSHPNVVAVYDVELDDAGLTLAMEYVRGQTLRTWLETDRSWAQVVDAFIEAGRGLAAAHAHGFIQRDFKPSNVLVADDGRVRVTDFGVAKLVGDAEAIAGVLAPSMPGADEDLRDDDLTGHGTLVGTLRYMSPEQHAAQDADPSSDQYAYCVALWESLSSVSPFAGTEAEIADLKRAGPPPWPTSVPLPRPILAVIERGLRPEPAERWPNMDALLDALISARQPGGRRALRAGAVVLGLCTAGALGFAATRDGPCEDLPQDLAGDWSEEVASGLGQEVRAADVPFAGQTASLITQRLDEYAQRWADAERDNCEATLVHRRQSERLMDKASLCLDRSRGHFVAALATVREQAAVADIEQLPRMVSALPPVSRCRDAEWLAAEVEPPAPEDQVTEVRRLEVILARAAAQNEAGNAEASLETTTPHIAEVDASGYVPLIAQAARLRGDALVDVGRIDDGEVELRRAYQLALGVGDDRAAAGSARQLGHLRGIELGHPAEGLAFVETGLALAQRSSAGPRDRISLGSMHGLLLQRLGRVEEALAELRELTESAREELPVEDPVRSAVEASLGVALYENGFNVDALEVHRVVFEARREALGEEHPATAGGRVNIAIALDALGRSEEAAVELRAAQVVFRGIYGETHPRTALCELNLSVVYANLGDHAAALRSADAALQQFRDLDGPRHPSVGRAQARRGVALHLAGAFADAQAAFRAAVSIAQETGGEEQLEGLSWRIKLARVMSRGGDRAGGLAEAEAALSIMRKVLPADHVELGAALETVGEILIELDRADEAVPILESVLETFGEGQLRPTARAVVSFKLARALRETGAQERAVATAMKAREGLNSGGGYATDRDLLEEIDAWLDSPRRNLQARETSRE